MAKIKALVWKLYFSGTISFNQIRFVDLSQVHSEKHQMVVMVMSMGSKPDCLSSDAGPATP